MRRLLKTLLTCHSFALLRTASEGAKPVGARHAMSLLKGIDSSPPKADQNDKQCCVDFCRALR